MATVVEKTGIRREKGWLYFLDKKGRRQPCPDGSRRRQGPQGPREGRQVRSSSERMGFLYFIDKKGNVAKVKMKRAPRAERSERTPQDRARKAGRPRPSQGRAQEDRSQEEACRPKEAAKKTARKKPARRKARRRPRARRPLARRARRARKARTRKKPATALGGSCARVAGRLRRGAVAQTLEPKRGPDVHAGKRGFPERAAATSRRRAGPPARFVPSAPEPLETKRVLPSGPACRYLPTSARCLTRVRDGKA